jgi:hypothetical protein
MVSQAALLVLLLGTVVFLVVSCESYRICNDTPQVMPLDALSPICRQSETI